MLKPQNKFTYHFDFVKVFNVYSIDQCMIYSILVFAIFYWIFFKNFISSRFQIVHQRLQKLQILYDRYEKNIIKIVVPVVVIARNPRNPMHIFSTDRYQLQCFLDEPVIFKIIFFSWNQFQEIFLEKMKINLPYGLDIAGNISDHARHFVPQW